MPQDIVTRVNRNVDLGHGNYLLEFPAAELIDGMQAAQFFMIGIPGAEMLLRRPFSVCGLPGTFDDGADGAAQVLYKVLGKGTGLLATLGEGAPLTVLGPLGHGFGLPAKGSGQRTVFVAGGIGSAPFPAQADALRRRGAPAPTMLYGARTAGDLPLLDWFREHCREVVVTTDDGSAGRRGLVTEPLEELLSGGPTEDLLVQACGPRPMLEAVARLVRRHGVACELSLEAHMACGFGVCLGCVVPTHGTRPGEINYERLCVEGPVMRVERLAW